MTNSIRQSNGNAATHLVRRLWQYCSVLRDDGLSYPDYVEQLTYLLFLKMADEQVDSPIPSGQGWQSFAQLGSVAMHQQYSIVLAHLGEMGGTLGLIFGGAKNKIRDPGKLRLLVTDLIGAEEWSGFSADVKGDAYEGLLEKNARDTKSGAGQYFTPRPLIDAIVDCMNPQPGEVICDPACGTGGFLLAAHDYLVRTDPAMRKKGRDFLRTKALRGVELVQEVARLATMNLFLHGVHGDRDADLPIRHADSLAEVPSDYVDVVITNPPFGVKGSVTYTRAGKSRKSVDDLTVVRPDFWVKTANKQLNFVQHIVSLLRPGGRAAVVLPDNVLYEGGAGTAIRRRLLETCNVHTLLRLPTGLFYAQGVMANVLFFDNSAPTVSDSDSLLVYDLRSDNRFTLKARPLEYDDLSEFITLFKNRGQESREGNRWRTYSRSQILSETDCSLHLAWSPDEHMTAAAEPQLEAIAAEIASNLREALRHITAAADSAS